MEKLTFKREAIFWPLLILPIAYALYIWGQLPDRIAIHFALDGTPNGWAGRWAIFICPFMNIGIYLLILFLPQIDPKRMDKDDFNAMFYKIRFTIVFFMCFMSFIAVSAAIKGRMDLAIAHAIVVGTFILLSILGNFMINIKPNWFIGVRTPWTLSSDAVWRRTHQVVGRLWFYGGLVCAMLSLLTPDKWMVGLILTFALGSAGFAFAYSFWLYKREKENSAA